MLGNSQVNPFDPNNGIPSLTSNNAAYADPELFRLMLAQQINTNLNTLLNNDDDDNNSSSNSIFGSSNTSSLFPNTNFNTSSLNGAQAQSPALQMVLQANLIGKNVTAVNPQTGQTIKGTVDSVLVENNQVLLNVGGIKLSPENLISIEGGDLDA